MKTQPIESVLHDWVHALPFQMQALLMTGMRGPDSCRKEEDAKRFVRFLRGAVLKPAGDWHGKNDNNFMWGEYEIFAIEMAYFWNDHDHYPHHFIMHLIHCAEVVGYFHPDDFIRSNWQAFYLMGCDSFHMHPETKEEMRKRLNDFKG